jgi:quinol monooxygenase YgiN
MPYIRVSLMQPKDGRADEVRSLLEDLANYFKIQPGFIEGYSLHSPALIGRVTVWDSDSAADAAAQSDHVLAVRSQLNADVIAGSHEEHAFEGVRFAPMA